MHVSAEHLGPVGPKCTNVPRLIRNPMLRGVSSPGLILPCATLMPANLAIYILSVIPVYTLDVLADRSVIPT